MIDKQTDLKRQAAEAAIDEVTDGMVLGLGTGSTAALAVEALGRRVAAGLRIVGIPTSERTADQARKLGIPLTDLATHPVIDLTIDGADEAQPDSFTLIKGLGGALLREKIVASASRRMTVVVDESKIVQTLGQVRLPVEIVAFGHQATTRLVQAIAPDAVLRLADGQPYVTDGGNHILDLHLPIPDPAALAARLKAITGVVDHGLFIGIATRIIVGTPEGPRVLEN